MKHYDVVIIGAGTAGLSARKEVAKKTDNYIVVDDGPLGTTCARVGCMPSKVLIQVANDFDRRKKMEQMGILGGNQLSVDSTRVMAHVRALRDRFVKGVKSPMAAWSDKLIPKRAQFKDLHTLEIGGELVKADKIIIATGSRPVLPVEWLPYQDFLIDTDSFFELPELPQAVAVIGLGVIGVEIGQALHKLGVKVIGVTVGKAIGGLSDPALQDYVAQKLSAEMPVYFTGATLVGKTSAGKIQVSADGTVFEVDKIIATVGRRANVDKLGLQNLGISLDKKGMPDVDSNTMKLKQAPHIFLPGDANGDRAILHEAADEGVIAGYNAVNEEQCFRRRTPMAITFSEPNIAVVGKHYFQLKNDQDSFVTGKVSFEGQGRSIVKLKEQGLLHIYADNPTGTILGAELQSPDGEHLAHLIAWAISLKLTVFEALKLPFYHPVIEEGLRTALRDAALQLALQLDLQLDSGEHKFELLRCGDAPIR